MENTVPLDEVREEFEYLTQSLIKEMENIVKSGKRTRTFQRNPEAMTALAIFFGVKPDGIFDGIVNNSRTSAVRITPLVEPSYGSAPAVQPAPLTANRAHPVS